jgi:hypothetical protein
MGVDAPDPDLAQQDDGGPDGQADTGTQPDIGPDLLPAGDAGAGAAGKCATAPTVTLTSGTVTITDDITNYTDEFSSLACRTSSTSTTVMDGPQAYYKFQGVQDQWYRFVLEPTSTSFSANMYIFTSTACTEAAIQTDCQSEGVTGASLRQAADGDDPRVQYFKAPANGPIYVAVDDTFAPSDGKFKLTITAITTPTNGTCATATQLNFFNGKAVANGDTHDLMTPDEFATLNCSGSTSTFNNLDGPNAYFKFDAKANTSYKIKVTNLAGYFLYYYVTGNSCVEADIQTACASAGASGDYMSSSFDAPQERQLVFTPPAPGTYTIGIDGNDVYDYGYFTVEVEEFVLPTNGKCATPDAVALINGKATITGSTLGLTNEFGTDIDCTGFTDFDGPQAYYELDAKAGKYYDISVTPQFSAYVYAFSSTNCGSSPGINGDCGSQGATGFEDGSISSGSTRNIVFKPTAPGKYTLAIDSSAPTTNGDYTIVIEEKDAPTNDTCTTATPLSFTAGKATVKGTTKGAANENGSSIDCTGSSDFVGPQVYYSFTAQASKGYKISLSPSFASYLYVYTQGACGALASAINAACGSNGADGDVVGPISASGTMLFKPVNAGTYIIAVDSSSASNLGDFDLTVEELDPPANQTCAAATPVSFTNGKLTIQGTTAFGSDEFPGVVNCGKSSPFDGPQAYYSYSATAGSNYWVQLNSTFDNAYLYVFSGACTGANIQASCSSGTSGAVLGPVNTGSKAIYLKAPAAGTFTLAVDSDLTGANDEFGDFTVNVEEFTTATNATCAAAQQITLTNNSAQVSGFTVGTADEFAGLVKCGGTTAFAAGQTYYKVDLTAGLEYTFTISADFAAKAYYFRGAANCAATAIETDCAGTTAGDGGLLSITAGGQKKVTFIPTVSQPYYIAVDGAAASDEGRYQISISAFVIPTLTVPTTGLTLDFETSNGGLAAKGDWEWGQINWQGGTCGVPPANNQGHVPTQTGMWGTVLNNCYTNAGSNQGGCSTGSTDKSDDSILTFNLAIPASWTTAKLEYWEHADVFINFDWAEVWVDGKLDTATQICSGGSSAQKWEKKSIDLSAYVGKTVNIAFHMMASSVVEDAGWYIDEISVSK